MRQQEFLVNGQAICTVTQSINTVDFTLYAPELSWWAWFGQQSPTTARQIAQTFTDAADVLEAWSKDTGKPSKEVIN